MQGSVLLTHWVFTGEQAFDWHSRSTQWDPIAAFRTSFKRSEGIGPIFDSGIEWWFLDTMNYSRDFKRFPGLFLNNTSPVVRCTKIPQSRELQNNFAAVGGGGPLQKAEFLLQKLNHEGRNLICWTPSAEIWKLEHPIPLYCLTRRDSKNRIG